MAGSSEPAFSFLYTKIKDPAKPGSSENKKSARRDSKTYVSYKYLKFNGGSTVLTPCIQVVYISVTLASTVK